MMGSRFRVAKMYGVSGLLAFCVVVLSCSFSEERKCTSSDTCAVKTMYVRRSQEAPLLCFFDLASCFFEGFWTTPRAYLDLGPMKKTRESITPVITRNLTVVITTIVIISSTPCTRPHYDVTCQWLRGDCEQSCLQCLHVKSERKSPSWDCPTPKNLRAKLTLRVPPSITSRKWN